MRLFSYRAGVYICMWNSSVFGVVYILMLYSALVKVTVQQLNVANVEIKI